MFQRAPDPRVPARPVRLAGAPIDLRPLPDDPDEVRVDIVIDNYEYGRFVADAVESALAQTHPSVRVIAVDDGSRDDSRSVLARYVDAIDVVLKDNGGQASALNAGLAQCDGDVVIFLDADDALRPDAVATVVRAFVRDPRIVQVQYRLEVVDAGGSRTGALKPPPDVPLPSGDIAAAKMTFPFDVVTLGTSGNAFRIEALRRIAPIPESEFARCGDWYLVHLVPLLGRVAAVERVLGSYRVHGGNGYELDTVRLDLDHVRQTILFAAATTPALERLAAEVGLRPPYDGILSVSDLANRLVSLRLAPELHPCDGDDVLRIARDGTRAAWRRFDGPPLMKILFVVWFWAVALGPRWVVVRLALAFLFRERRGRWLRLLRRSQNRRWERAVAARVP